LQDSGRAGQDLLEADSDLSLNIAAGSPASGAAKRRSPKGLFEDFENIGYIAWEQVSAQTASVVLAALLWVRQDGVCLTDFLELALSVGIAVVHVWMVRARQATVDSLYFTF